MKRITSMMIILSLTFIYIPAYAGVETTAKSVVLMEAETGELLLEKEKDEQLPIASVTKIMTMLLIMEEIASGKLTLADEVTVSEYAMSMGGSTMFLETGEVLSVSDMLKGIAVASANDGCVAMAEHISGTTDAFVEKMNMRAKELGMENTNFINTNGLDAEGHYSSAYDVALMAKELIKHEKIFDYTTIWTDSLRDGKFELANTNRMIRFYRGATGLKTGSTDKAGCCLCATAERDGVSLIAVVLGAPTSKDRFSDATSLLDYGFANYSVAHPVSKGEELGSVQVKKGVEETVKAVAKEDFQKVIKKGDGAKVEMKLTIAEELTAPVVAGEVIGRAEFYIENESIGVVDVVTDSDVKKKSILEMINDILKSIAGIRF